MKRIEHFAVLMRPGDRMHWTGQGLMDIVSIEELPAIPDGAGDYHQDTFLRVTGVLCERRITVDLHPDDVCTFDSTNPMWDEQEMWDEGEELP